MSAFERAQNYVEKMDPAIEGQGGHLATWRVAQVLVRGFSLTDQEARTIIDEYNARCSPAWSARELNHKIQSAKTTSKVPQGYLLTGNEWKPEFDGSSMPHVGRPSPLTPDAGTAPINTVSPDLESWWLPKPVEAWVNAVSEFCNTPKTMAIAAALCAAASVVQGKVRVEMAPGIVQPLTLFWAVLARPGGRKSTVMTFAAAPIIAMQRAEEERIKPDIIAKSNEKARLEAQIQRLRRAAKAHKYSEGAQEHMQQLRELEHEHAQCQVPSAPQWLHDDINPTSLPTVLQRNLESEDGCARATIWAEEGTFFQNLAGRYSGTTMAETVNQAYSGSPLRSTRKLNGTRDLIDVQIDACFLTVCVFTQPHYRELLAGQSLADCGFTGRLILSECNVGPRPTLGSTRPPSQEILDGYAEWLARLAAIPSGSVYVIGDAARALLGAHMAEVDQLAMGDQGGQAWCLRSPERVARILALCELDGAEWDGSRCQSVRVSDYSPGGSRVREEIKVQIIISSLYIAYLGVAQAHEPAPSLPAPDGVRLLDTLTAGGFGPGMVVTTRQLQRVKTWPLERVLNACHKLVELGCLERTEVPTQAGRRTLKEAYRIVRLTLDESD